MPPSKLTDPRFVAAFTAYAILVGVFSSTTATLVEIQGAAGLWTCWALCLVAMLVLWRIYDPQIRAWFSKRERPITLRLSTDYHVRPAVGLTLLVGRENSYLFNISAVNHHSLTLRYLWLLHSNDETSTRGAAEIEAHAVQKVPNLKVHKHLVHDLFSIEEAKKAIELIRRNASHAGISPPDFICDFTGMSKPISAGVVLACIRPEHRLQYMEPNAFSGERPNPQAGAKPIEVVVNYDVDLV
jgi:hypothetical protein